MFLYHPKNISRQAPLGPSYGAGATRPGPLTSRDPADGKANQAFNSAFVF